MNPVDRKAVPDYYEHIKFPMDMKTMAERLKANYYVNKRLFIADMKRYVNQSQRVFLKKLGSLYSWLGKGSSIHVCIKGGEEGFMFDSVS